MISELMPEGYDNMFFALFGITNRAVRIGHILQPNQLSQTLTFISIYSHL